MNFAKRLGLLALLMGSSIWSHAAGEPLGVVYPKSQLRATEKIIDDIISGIKNAAGDGIDKYPLDESFDTGRLKSEIQANRNRVIIAIDPISKKAVRAMDLDIPVVLGGRINTELAESDKKEVAGISTLPDPQIVFEKLLSIAPTVKVVSVVYNPDRYQSLIRDALDEAARAGLQLVTREARDPHSSAKMYQEIVDKEFAGSVDGRNNAIWLLDMQIIERSVFNELLQKAWDRKFIVFSSGLSSNVAKRGALFSLYPDYVKMGIELEKLARQAEANPVPIGIARARSLDHYINKRAANHLRIDSPLREDDSYDQTE